LYEATLETFWNKPWFQGIFWCYWFEYDLISYGWGGGGPSDTGPSPQNKLAEQVLRSWYAKPQIPEGTPSEAAPVLVAIQKAETAIANATREERTMGLDQAKNLLSQAIQAYDQGNVSRSEPLADRAVVAANGSASQKDYDSAAAVVNLAFEKLSSLRNVTLQSTDAIQLRQQSEAEYSSALAALNANQFDLAKTHANNTSTLVEEALIVERTYQISSTSSMSVASQNPALSSSVNLFYAITAIGVATLVAISAIVTMKKRRIKRQ
jgi:hypothetical protein